MEQDLRQLAGRFLQFVHGATRLPVIVCDENGTIVLAIDKKRIGTTHAAAARIMAGELEEAVVTAEDAARDPRMKEGCNVGIVVDGRRVGTFGIAGPVALAQPITRIAATVIASWAREQRQRQALEAAAGDVLRGVQNVSGHSASVASRTQETIDVMTRASSEATAKVEKSGEIVRTVQEIAQKSRILSINGSVEASRAGDQGRAFAVVAREMIQLAEDARGASNQIAATLEQVKSAIAQLREAIGRSADLAKTQTAALSEVSGVVEGLQRAISDVMRAA